MKSFQAVLIAALAISTVAIDEPVASPTAATEREFAEYERKLGVTGTPTEFPPRPTGGTPVSIAILFVLLNDGGGGEKKRVCGRRGRSPDVSWPPAA